MPLNENYLLYVIMYRNKNFDSNINISKHFFIIKTFISNATLKLEKKAKAKQHPKV